MRLAGQQQGQAGRGHERWGGPNPADADESSTTPSRRFHVRGRSESPQIRQIARHLSGVLSGPSRAVCARADAPVELWFGPEARRQPPSAGTVSRQASAQAASSTSTPDARLLPVHAAQMSMDSTSILRSRTSGSGISACAAPSTA